MSGADSHSSGKSVLMRVLCCTWLFKKNAKIGYICKNYILAKKFYKDFVSIFPSQFVKSSNGSDLTIETTFNSALTFFSAESGNSLRGLTFDYLILDEFAFFKQELPSGEHLWNEVLFPTIKAKGKKIIFVSTPAGKHNLFYEMYLRGISEEYPNYASLLKNIYDDGFVTETEIEDIRKSIPDLAFQQEFECKFLDSSLTFFTNFENCFKNYSYNYNKTWIGIDLSGNGQDATILTKINEKNEIEQFKINGTLDNKYKQISNIINNSINLQAVYIEQNGIGAPIINEILKLVKNRSLIHNWLTTNDSKEKIISNLAVKIVNEEIYFNNNDTELFSEFGTFIVKYSKTNKLIFEAQGGKHDDRILSLAMALECKEEYKFENNIVFIKPDIWEGRRRNL